ncbi:MULTISPECIES: TraI domain-containing protein [unclassified Paraburkholderia]|uniref:TraI domain-containing protein n=1 Tax=unclassified Paraburkholderia TaxID=2615204 RepID=UPI002AB10169|nr:MULTISPECIES: TraI domain-containing protein [unclassified Paraburkholderia]
MDFPLTSSSDLLKRLEAETGLLTRIQSSSEARADVFASYWQPLITAVADYVQGCPLEQVCFSEPGGLLRYALMSAYYALQISNQQFFTGKHGAEERRVLVPQYRFAVFFATLAGIPATMHARVIIKAGAKTWTPFHSAPALKDWVTAVGANQFSVEWRLAELKISQPNAIVWSADIVGIGTWQNLREEVAMLAHEAIYQVDSKAGESPVTSCVRLAYRTAREFETRAMTGQYLKKDLPEGVTPEAIAQFGAGLNTAAKDSASPPSPVPSGVAAHPPTPALPDAVEVTAPPEVNIPPSEAQGSVPKAAAPAVAQYPDIILDIFKAIRALPNYEEVKKLCNETESGIAVPVTIFAKHGMPSAKVFELLEQNKLIVQMSPTRKSLVLPKSVRSLLLG